MIVSEILYCFKVSFDCEINGLILTQNLRKMDFNGFYKNSHTYKMREHIVFHTYHQWRITDPLSFGRRLLQLKEINDFPIQQNMAELIQT